MKKLIYFIILLLSLTLVTALNTELAPTEANHANNNIVTASISGCVGVSAVEVTNSENKLVQVGQGVGEWELKYNTNSDAGQGKYLMDTSCDDGTTDKEGFCVDAPGCLLSANPGPRNTGSPGGYSGDRRSSGGSSGALAPCLMNWQCESWSTCSAGTQSRTCSRVDNCEERVSQGLSASVTTLAKPSERQSCQTASTGQTRTAPPKKAPKKAYVPQVQLPEPSSFWEDYKIFIISVPIGLIILAIIIILIIHHLHKTKDHEVHDYTALREWVQKERSMGTPDAHIHEMLVQETGWKEEEISKVFTELAGAVDPASQQPATQPAPQQPAQPV